MPLMNWSQELCTGIASIDEEHKVLIGLLNGLYDGLHEGHCCETVHKTFEGLLVYIVTHFEHEEEYMLATNYPDTEEHKAEHERLRQQVMLLHEKAALMPCGSLSNELLAFLKGWVRGHIMHCDKAFGPHLLAHGIK